LVGNVGSGIVSVQDFIQGMEPTEIAWIKIVSFHCGLVGFLMFGQVSNSDIFQSGTPEWQISSALLKSRKLDGPSWNFRWPVVLDKICESLNAPASKRGLHRSWL
jgi:hypothetical protein